MQSPLGPLFDFNNPNLDAEFVKARDEYFSTVAHKSTRKWVEQKTGVEMNPPAKRNGRTKKDHLQRVNRLRKIKADEFGDTYGGGRPPESGSKKEAVQEWRKRTQMVPKWSATVIRVYPGPP